MVRYTKRLDRISGSLGHFAVLCNDASFDPKLGAAAASGDTVDLAFLVLAAKASLDVVDLPRRIRAWLRFRLMPSASTRRASIGTRANIGST